MKLAAFSDVHSNLPALEAILEDIERLGGDIQIIVNGDFLNVGPFPRETLEMVRAIPNAKIIAGNHEGYILEQARYAQVGGPPAPFQVLHAPSIWSYRQLTQAELHWLDNLPLNAEFDGPENRKIKIVHGSPRRQMEALYPELSEKQLEEIFQDYLFPGCLWISGHSHRPALHYHKGMTIVNNGSAGLPLDGDWRASYTFAEWDEKRKEWRVENRRVAYDRERAIRATQANTAYEQGGPYMKLILQNLKTSQNGRISDFIRSYIQAGNFPAPPHDFVHFDRAVEAYLAQFK